MRREASSGSRKWVRVHWHPDLETALERQRREAGMYDAPRLPGDEIERRLFEWGHPKLAHRLRERGIPYPRVAPDGSLDLR